MFMIIRMLSAFFYYESFYIKYALAEKSLRQSVTILSVETEFRLEIYLIFMRQFLHGIRENRAK
jgi:hypothetical protein